MKSKNPIIGIVILTALVIWIKVPQISESVGILFRKYFFKLLNIN